MQANLYTPEGKLRSFVNVITSVDGDKTTGHAKITNSFLLTGTGEEDKAFVAQPIEVS